MHANVVVHALSTGMSAKSGIQQTLKILMLHGYTQSGPLFDAKTKALQKTLRKTFPGIYLSFPTGPLKLRASHVPGSEANAEDDTEIEAYGWWRRSSTVEPPEYMGFDEGLDFVANILKQEGPFDGVIGFSQGAAMAVMISSLLEGESRREAFKKAEDSSNLAIPFPSSFAGLSYPPMKFCVTYSGFIAPGERYAAFYHPCVNTPTCQFIGSLDTVVEESRAEALIEATGGRDRANIIVHPGGHFVPNSRQYIDSLAAFVKAKVTESEQKSQQDERVEDMDVPF